MTLLQFCINKGGWLAEILSPEENSNLKPVFMQSGKYYWIGLTDSAVEGHFVWQHSLKPMIWSNWSPYQPDNAKGNEDCVEVGWPAEFKWNDGDCNYSATFALCEFFQDS